MEAPIPSPGYTRQAAAKVSISQILQGIFIQGQDEPSCFQTADGQRLFRVNLMASLLDKEKTGSVMVLLLDDGTGQIALRCFEESSRINSLSVGDVLLIVGRVRSYNQEKYLSAEIAKKVEPSWLKVRKEELKTFQEEINTKEINKNHFEEIPKEVSEEIIQEKGEALAGDASFPAEKIIKAIQELDHGPGALIEEIMEKLPLPEVEQAIEKMLKEGLIFQIQPGRVKVL